MSSDIEKEIEQAKNLHMAGRLPEAENLYNKILSEESDNIQTLYLLGVLLHQTGKSERAVDLLHKALAVKSDFTEAHYFLGGVLVTQGKIAEAISCYRKVISLVPDFAHAHFDLGIALQEQRKFDEAIAAYRQSLGLKPDNFNAHKNLANSLREQGKLEEAISSYRQALKLKPDDLRIRSGIIYPMNYMTDVTQEEIYNETKNWAHRIEDLEKKESEYQNSLTTDRKLRIGYVSPDYRAHSVIFFIEPVVRTHDRSRVEVFCYSNVKEPDEATELMQNLADHWYSLVGKSDEEVIRKIKSDEIDILVDLAGHTSDNNLSVFACKPAPVQVTWLGYPNTTGLQAMDYRLTDEIADPFDGPDKYYSEKLMRLEKGFLCYKPVQAVLGVSSLPCGDNGHITFGSFNNLSKVRPEVIKAWAGILQTVPDSQLLLKAKQFKDQQMINYFRERFAEEGITPDRLKMFDKIPSSEEHLSMYNKVDIGLDTFPYNGTTTTCEALWMGVPVITLVGDRHAGRVGSSILQRIGLQEFVASTVDEYIELARSLAFDRERLQGIRSNMRDRMLNSELMDSKLFTGKLEDAYFHMWQEYCDKMQAMH